MRLITPEISWHGKEPLFSLDFSLNNKSARLATSGADSNVRIWAVHDDGKNGSSVEFISDLSRHTKAVNVVRFSPRGKMLASGGDDCYVIIWKLSDDNIEGMSQLGSMDCGNVESKESWQVAKMLRGHIEDVYDLAWSPDATQLISGSVDNSVIIWDTNKGDKLRILKDHRQYVQGVCWDPCGSYVVSYSCDRTCRIYSTSNYRCVYNINKMTIPSSSKNEIGNQNSKQIKIFHDETMPSFFRRLTFSPDGLLLLVPGGKFEVKEKAVNTTFVFTKASMNKPVMYFPATKKPTIAVKCCPVLFELRNPDKSSNDNKKSVFKLPYRIVIAVASLDSVVLYDTQRSFPFGFLSNMHYASLTDIAWSGDGKILAISSRDGYCSLVTFDDNELGVPYSQTVSEVIENAAGPKENSPSRRNIVTPCSKTPDSVKDERISPKIEKLSIKKFVTVNATKSNSSQTSRGHNKIMTNNGGSDGQRISEPVPRRVGFVSMESSSEKRSVTQDSIPNPYNTRPSTVTTPAVAMATVSMVTQPRRVNFTTLQSGRSSSLEQGKTASITQSVDADHSDSSKSQPSPSTDGTRNHNVTTVPQPRRIGFVTLQSPKNTFPHDSIVKTTSSHAKALNVQSSPETTTHEEIKPDSMDSSKQPRRVGFVTLVSSKSSALPQQSSNANLTATLRTNKNELSPPVAREGKLKCTPSPQASPCRVDFATLQPRQTSSGTKTVPLIASNTNTTSPDAANTALVRQDRPPVPLEPQVIIITD